MLSERAFGSHTAIKDILPLPNKKAADLLKRMYLVNLH